MLRAFTYHQPVTVQEACELLAYYEGDVRPYAGGTSLLTLMKQGLFHVENLVNLKRLADLRTIEVEGDGTLTIGALVTHRALELSPLIREYLPILSEVEHELANVRVRAAGTIGGSLAFAEAQSDPPTVLAALGAEVRLQSARGERWVSLDEFYVDYYETVTAPDEILTHVRIPAALPRGGAAYVKFCNRGRSDKPTVGVMVALVRSMPSGSTTAAETRSPARTGWETCIMLGAVGPTPIRAVQAEACLIAEGLTPAGLRAAAAAVAESAQPIDDLYGSAAYKRAMARVMARRALERAMQRAGLL